MPLLALLLARSLLALSARGCGLWLCVISRLSGSLLNGITPSMLRGPFLGSLWSSSPRGLWLPWCSRGSRLFGLLGRLLGPPILLRLRLALFGGILRLRLGATWFMGLILRSLLLVRPRFSFRSFLPDSPSFLPLEGGGPGPPPSTLPPCGRGLGPLPRPPPALVAAGTGCVWRFRLGAATVGRQAILSWCGSVSRRESMALPTRRYGMRFAMLCGWCRWMKTWSC